VADLFETGQTERVLGDTIVQWQQRSCNEVTGCTAWEDLSPWFAGVNYAGTTQLRIPGTQGFRLDFLGNTHNGAATVARCHVADGDVHCDSENYLGTDHIQIAGEMNQGCARVTGTRRYPTTGTVANEYRVAMLTRFEAPEPEPEPEPLPIDDPHNPDSCQGPLLDHAGVIALFEPGATEATLGESEVAWQSRHCNETTGCTEWNAMGSSIAGVQWGGDAELRVAGNGVRLRMLGSVHGGSTTVADCAIDGGIVTCNPRNYVGTDHISIEGELRDGCLRLSGWDQYNVGGQTFGTEYRVAMLATF